jgi:hypothetical protein
VRIPVRRMRSIQKSSRPGIEAWPRHGDTGVVGDVLAPPTSSLRKPDRFYENPDRRDGRELPHAASHVPMGGSAADRRGLRGSDSIVDLPNHCAICDDTAVVVLRLEFSLGYGRHPGGVCRSRRDELRSVDPDQSHSDQRVDPRRHEPHRIAWNHQQHICNIRESVRRPGSAEHRQHLHGDQSIGHDRAERCHD